MNTIGPQGPHDDETDTDSAELIAARTAAAAFRVKVRDEILTRRFAGQWCVEGTRQVLDDLDLPPLRVHHAGIVTIQLDVSSVDESSYDTARARLIRGLSVVSDDPGIVLTADIDIRPALDTCYLDDRGGDTAAGTEAAPF